MTESLAAATRRAARETPFLVTALRAGVLNYAAAARFVDVEGDHESVATALRRFAEDLPDYGTATSEATVRVESGLDRVSAGGDAAPDAPPLLSVADADFAPGDGSLTAVVASGDVGADALAAVLSRLGVEGVTVEAAGVADGGLAVVVDRRDGAAALRATEAALDAVPTRPDGVSTA